MWFALELGGTPGVIVVRLAGSAPALLFGFFGGLAAARWPIRRPLLTADWMRALILLPLVIIGFTGALTIPHLIVASFLLEVATSFFAPAYGVALAAAAGRDR